MRSYLAVLALATAGFAAESQEAVTLHGTLIVREGKPAVIETLDRKSIELTGDAPTVKVLGDARLNGFQIQARGRFTSPGRFTIDPLHSRALLVRKEGGLKMISYWCDICSIRAYTPGVCACCQDETQVSLVDADNPNPK
jgi:hypothetical protein